LRGRSRPGRPAIPEPAAAISIRGLVVDYGSHRALDGLDLEIPSSGVFGLLGRNGAGKTTTIRAVAGLVRPSAGSISVLGDSPGPDFAGRRRISVLFAEDGLVVNMTASENLEAWGVVNGLPRRRCRSLAAAAMEKLGVARQGGRLVRDLSTGVRRMVALARAFMLDRPLVLLDEPTASLDPVKAAEARTMLRDLASDRPILLSTHNLSEAEEICCSVAIIHLGRMVFSGAPGLSGPDGVYDVGVDGSSLSWRGSALSPGEKGLFLLASGCGPADTLGELISSGFRITEFRPRRRSLADVFRELAG
jgi:ABC-type multidrug transport system ATPase subunit